MDPTFWAAAAAIIAALGLGAALARHVSSNAYQRGISDQRIKALEDKVKETSNVGGAIERLNATVDSLASSVNRLDAVVENIRQRPGVQRKTAA